MKNQKFGLAVQGRDRWFVFVCVFLIAGRGFEHAVLACARILIVLSHKSFNEIHLRAICSNASVLFVKMKWRITFHFRHGRV